VGSILIVEDDASVRAILSLMLVRMGHEVIGTATVRASVEAVLGQKPLDLAVLDAILPDGSGCQVAKVAEISRPTLPIMLIAAMDGASFLHCGYLDVRLLTANRKVRFSAKALSV
jgi:two-component system cell cycle sensor histidine kinase/response regulator CckA